MTAKKKNKVLLIEPDSFLAKIYVQAIESEGIIVQSASKAQEAISAIDKIKPDLIVLELQLPSNNGIEFLYELRSYSDLQDIKVIVLSFISSLELALTPKQAQILNIYKHLYKPKTSVSELVEAVNEVFGR